jgi:hypothetical protein
MTRHKKYSNLDEWKTEVETSSHIREGEMVEYTHDYEKCGIVSAHIVKIDKPSFVNIFIGAYSIKNSKDFAIDNGWYYP